MDLSGAAGGCDGSPPFQMAVLADDNRPAFKYFKNKFYQDAAYNRRIPDPGGAHSTVPSYRLVATRLHKCVSTLLLTGLGLNIINTSLTVLEHSLGEYLMLAALISPLLAANP